MKEDPRNIGALDTKDPRSDRTNTITNPDRALVRLLQSVVDRFKRYPDEAREFWQHFFEVDQPQEKSVMEAMIARFQSNPPIVRLGYSKLGAEMPMIAIVLDAESESEGDGQYLGNEVGEDYLDDEDEDEAYGAPTPQPAQSKYLNRVGTIDEVAFFIYVYSVHADECSYLHKFVKAALYGGSDYLDSRGLMGFKLSGGELAPDPEQEGLTVYTRFVRIAGKTQTVVPRILDVNPEKFRITGLYMDDVIVDGIQGGVHAVGSSIDE